MGRDLFLRLTGPKPGNFYIKVFCFLFFLQSASPVSGSRELLHAHGVRNSGFFKVKSYSSCKSAENFRRHSVPLGPVMTASAEQDTGHITHKVSEKSHHPYGPASKRRAEKAVIIHLLVSNFYRQKCFQIIFFLKKIPRPWRMERVLRILEGGGVGSGPSTHCGLTSNLWARSKLVLTSLQIGKVHLSAL